MALPQKTKLKKLFSLQSTNLPHLLTVWTVL